MVIRRYLGIGLVLGLVVVGTGSAHGATKGFAAVERVIASEVSGWAGHRTGDLISKKDVNAILSALARNGWKVAESEDILKQTLPDNHVVVQTLRTPAGRVFMRKVANYRLIYDRLDRVSQVYGGRRLVRDLVRLPDAERYAQMKPPRGVPDLRDLLPKTRSGRPEAVKDYDKPTGRIYTVEQLTQRLRECYEKASKKP